MENIKGRPKTYTDKELKDILINYATNNIGIIKYLQLEKATGIKRHVWSRRLGDEIKILNNTIINVDGEKFERIPLPNIVDTVNKYWENKEELINALIQYNDYIQNLWDKAIMYEKMKEIEQKLNCEIDELKKEITYFKNDRDYYKNEYEKIAVESTYQHKRTKKNIVNVLDVKDKRKLTSTNWENNFPDLFKK